MNMGTYGEASGQWGSCPAGFDKEAKTGSDRGLKTMLGLCARERQRHCVCECDKAKTNLHCMHVHSELFENCVQLVFSEHTPASCQSISSIDGHMSRPMFVLAVSIMKTYDLTTNLCFTVFASLCKPAPPSSPPKLLLTD